MFTGIVRELGTVVRREAGRRETRLVVYAPKTSREVKPAQSVAINGVCLSVVAIRRGTLTFDVIRQSQRLTTLGRLASGDRVNVEPSVSLGERIDGHLVFGHVDGVGTVHARRHTEHEELLLINLPNALSRLVVPRGPLAVDGVSLTIGEQLSPTRIAVYLIPTTLRLTTLGTRRAGDGVNLELDYFAKLTFHWLRARSR